MGSYTVTVNYTVSGGSFSFDPDTLTVSTGNNTIHFVRGNNSASNAWNFSSISFTEEGVGGDPSPFSPSLTSSEITVSDVVTKNETWDYSVQVNNSAWSDPKIVNRGT